MPSVDLLVSKKGKESFIDYCLKHPLVNEVILTPRFMRTKLMISFKDGSQLNFKLIRSMVRKSLECLQTSEIVKSSSVNDFGMLVPSNEHHYEYVFLKYQFSESAFPDKFQKYFSSLDVKGRTDIFRYIQPKYNLVFNVIEDLYVPKGGVLLKIMIGLRHMNSNTLMKMAFRFFQQGMWNLLHLFSPKSIILSSTTNVDPQSGESTLKEPIRETVNKKNRF